MRYSRPIVGLLCILIMALLVGCAGGTDATQVPPATAKASRATATAAEATAAALVPTVVEAVPTSPPIVAKVNGEAIERAPYELQVAQFQAAMISQGASFSGEEGKLPALQVRKQVLESMIDQVLIDQAIVEQGITVANDVLQQRIQQDIALGGGDEKFKEWLAKNGLTMEQYQETLRSAILTEELIRQLSVDVPKAMKQVHLRQILVADEAQARQIRNQLDAGADFAELAKQYSLDEGSRAGGGDRGFLPLGQSILLPEAETAIAALSAGQIAGPIASAHGYYLYQVVEIEDNRPVAEEVRQGITQGTFMTWLENQRAQASIERFVAFE